MTLNEYFNKCRFYLKTEDNSLLEDLNTFNKELLIKYPWLKLNNHEKSELLNTLLDMLPTGWRIALGDELCREIDEELKKYNYSAVEDIIKVDRKKFIGLNWRCDKLDSVQKIIDRYEELFQKVCIICGSQATKISPNLKAPYCSKCAEDLKISPLLNIEEYYFD